jgi:proteasome lid subunit RPN8/RPN11
LAVNRLVLSPSLKRKIEDEGARAFPNECCGIMLGRDVGERRVVEILDPVENEFEDSEKYHRFLITPKRLLQAEKDAGNSGRLVLGFYHSHPDHPAKPSEYDRTHGWPFYSYVIVSILQRKPDAMTCWVLDDVTEQFAEQQIISE